MDYAFLTETCGQCEPPNTEHAEDIADPGATRAEDPAGKSGSSMTVLVMQESECRSVWAYVLESKGASEYRAVSQICEDLETIGLKSDRIVIKSDQEGAIVAKPKEILRHRETEFGTGIDNSSVGDSDSNGTIERAIQDVEGQTRTLRAALEERVQERVDLDNPVVPWMVRHAAYLITRCRIRPNGRTSFQVMKGRRSNTKMAEFGEIVHFKIPKTNFMPGKFEDLWDEGVWLGCDVR